jgi:HD-GYP domain-containing protein (c-di-GMP phosphodiesterase class II)
LEDASLPLFGRRKEPEHGPEDLQAAFLGVASATTEEDLLEALRTEASKLVGAAIAAVFLYDPDYKDLHGRALSGRVIRFGLGQGAAGSVAQELGAWRSDHPEDEPGFEPAIDGLAGNAAPTSLLAVPITDENGELHGVVEVAEAAKGSFSEEDAAYLELFCEGVSRLIDSVRRGGEWRELVFKLAEAMGSAVDTRLGVMVNHSVRVRELAVALGEAMGLSRAELDCLELAALLKDVGRLQAAEGDGSDMGGRIHVFFAEAFMRSVGFPERLQRVQEIACSVHEHHDGTGFPRGVRGDQLPRAARVLALVNSYDMMLFAPAESGQRLSESEALERLRDGSGTLYDPDAVKTFLEKEIYVREKRLHARLERQTAVDVTPIMPDGEEGQPLECAALDISSGGMLFSYPEELPSGSLVRMVIHLPGERLEAMAKVVRVMPGEGGKFKVGVSFLWQGTA